MKPNVVKLKILQLFLKLIVLLYNFCINLLYNISMLQVFLIINIIFKYGIFKQIATYICSIQLFEFSNVFLSLQSVITNIFTSVRRLHRQGRQDRR